MTIRKARADGLTCILEFSHDPVVAEFETDELLCAATRYDRTRLRAHAEDELTEQQRRRFVAFLKRRTRHEPLAYILGAWDFFGRTFKTDKRALIPRSETEGLAERALEIVRDNQNLTWTICDVGTGCGAIAVTMAAETERFPVLATDISRTTLSLAKENASSLLSSADRERLTFTRSDLLNSFVTHHLSNQTADVFLLLANLPYLPLTDKQSLKPEVTKYEPTRALFTSQSGQQLNLKLLRQWAMFIKKDGRAFAALLEFDPPQASDLKVVAKKLFPSAHVRIVRDFNRKARFLEITDRRISGHLSSPRATSGRA